MNEQPKVCPLLSVGRADDPAQCVGDRCAWWCELRSYNARVRASDCAVLSLANSLDGINIGGVTVCES